MQKLSAASLADYLLELGTALLSYGCPTHRVEALVRILAVEEGHIAEPFALPTALFISVRAGSEPPVTRMVRVEQWSVHLQRLMLVDIIFNDVVDRRASIEAARERLDQLDRVPPPYPAPLLALAPAGAAAAGAVFFRGALPEIGLAAVSGGVLGLLGAQLGRRPELRILGDFLGGLTAALLAGLWTHFAPSLSREVLVLSTVILLLPGMSLTTGLAELAHKHIVSGSARVMEAFIVLLSILFGVASAVGLEQLVGGSPGAAVTRTGFGLPAQISAVLLASTCFGILFQVPRRYLPAAILSGVIGWATTGFGTRVLPGHLATFAGAVLVCLFGNSLARWTKRPAQLFLLPGMILLVPGSFGFLSLEAFLRGEFLGGAAKGFEMFMVGGALVTGLLVANVLLPARKVL